MRNILFLCTGNSARSIMAEAYMNKAGANGWSAYSAGSHPTGAPNPLALLTLEKYGLSDEAHDGAPRSKSWDEFARDDAPIMDVIVTVCDNAAGETCPIWPTSNGRAPLKLHWSFPDPAAANGTNEEKSAFFQKVFMSIRAKIDAFLNEQS